MAQETNFNALRHTAIAEIEAFHMDDSFRIYLPDQAVELKYEDGTVVNNPEYFQDWELKAIDTDSLWILLNALNEES